MLDVNALSGRGLPLIYGAECGADQAVPRLDDPVPTQASLEHLLRRHSVQSEHGLLQRGRIFGVQRRRDHLTHRPTLRKDMSST